MDYIRELMNVGDDVLRTVTSAIERNDFSSLSSDLKNRFGDFAEDVKEDARMRTSGTKARRSYYDRDMYWYDPESGRTGTSWKADPGMSGRKPGRMSGRAGRADGGAWNAGFRGNTREQQALTPFRPRIFGKGSSIAKMVAGVIGMLNFIPLTLGAFGATLMGEGALATLAVALPLAIGSVWLTVSGNRKRKLIDIYDRYGAIIGTEEYYPMEKLATYAGTSEEEAVSNIEKLMKAKMLPQGKFDENKTTLMLTPRMWKQYLAAEQSRQQREGAAQPEDFGTAGSREKSTVLEEGNEFVRKIHRFNTLIPDPDMSEKLSRLESTIQRIFRQLEKEPDSAPDLHKLMNYYLPTTEKLILAYIDLDDHPAGSENIDRMRREIEDAMDTINVAFDNLFNDLFQDTAWDISSDISVLKNMMKQDGLMEEQKGI